MRWSSILLAIFTVSSIILGIALAVLFVTLNFWIVILITVIALVGTILPLLLRGRCLLGDCEEEEEEGE